MLQSLCFFKSANSMICSLHYFIFQTFQLQHMISNIFLLFIFPICIVTFCSLHISKFSSSRHHLHQASLKTVIRSLLSCHQSCDSRAHDAMLPSIWLHISVTKIPPQYMIPTVDTPSETTPSTQLTSTSRDWIR